MVYKPIRTPTRIEKIERQILDTKRKVYSFCCMGYANSIGKYHLLRTIGEGNFAKVKLAINTENDKYVAMKVIDKKMVIKNNLMYQVQREIRTMKLLNHPNIVKIHEVIGTKTKIYIAMEYVSGGQLSNKMSYTNRLSEKEARKHFQQLIDAVDYCHCRGVYHRDLKPENLLLDNKGNLKVSDFGLSALRKPGDLLSTACGSPSYVAPELLHNKGYDGAAADIWSCGVILFELLAGHLPFNDQNLMNLYRKIMRAEYSFPEWFTEMQKKLISGILEPIARKRLTIAEIIENKWFQTNYEPAVRTDSEEDINLADVNAVLNAEKENDSKVKVSRAPRFINAFQLIAMSQDLDLSGFFVEQEDEKQKMTLGSKLTTIETIKKIEAAAKDVSLAVERMNSFKLKIRPNNKVTRCSRSCFNLAAEVIEVAPRHCVIEVSNSAGELGLYREFCKSLSSMLTEIPDTSSKTQIPKEANLRRKSVDTIKRSAYADNKEKKELRGYSSS